ncbi:MULTISPECIES: SRPBCC family protein [unclassified Lysinibacillus]|uniref:SRPBCC family protein n=1 Tax=unclassified Lysinibacillus TaxID=2636778 RepID=UPI0020118EA7|nr:MULTISPECIES: SRPBCC family protein [unclassified Lysinibacillus]MCL1697188.1 SRPBCC family protein [Lysinibacillus sp. BPa_S21]MCL1701880.1 SRPBCC family protein [Lysinibacillus sp. Bpr_S20]
MLATIQKQQNNYVVKFNRPLSHSVEAVWAVLTENEKLQKWMNNLEIIDLRKNGKIRFNMNDGTDASMEITITDYVESEVLEFDWGKDTVRFELSPTSSGSILVLVESIRELTEHTPKDLAGWHVCLNLLSDLLNGTVHEAFPMEEWQKWFAEYKQLVDDVEKI